MCNINQFEFKFFLFFFLYYLLKNCFCKYTNKKNLFYIILNFPDNSFCKIILEDNNLN